MVHERELAADWLQSVFAQQPKISPGAGREERVAHMNRLLAALEEAGEPPEGAYRWSSVYDLSGNPTPPGFQGTPLPRSVFAGPRDEWFGFRDGEFGVLDPALARTSSRTPALLAQKLDGRPNGGGAGVGEQERRSPRVVARPQQ